MGIKTLGGLGDLDLLSSGDCISGKTESSSQRLRFIGKCGAGKTYEFVTRIGNNVIFYLVRKNRVRVGSDGSLWSRPLSRIPSFTMDFDDPVNMAYFGDLRIKCGLEDWQTL